MIKFDQKADPTSVTIRRRDARVEVVRESNRGTTLQFDSPQDAARRLSAWISDASEAPKEPMSARALLQLTPTPESGHDGEVCPAGTIEVPARDAENRRSDARLHTSDVRWLRGARSMYGAEVRVVDISTNGILIDTDHELFRNTTIALELFGHKGTLRVVGRVLRCRRFYQGDIVWYQTACRFKRPVDLRALVPKFA